MGNDKRRAMFKSKDILAMIARPSETPLTAKSLHAVLAFYNSCIARLVSLCLVEGRENSKGEYHFGSLTSIPCDSLAPNPGGISTLQCSIRAQMLKAVAMGPKVP